MERVPPDEPERPDSPSGAAGEAATGTPVTNPPGRRTCKTVLVVAAAILVIIVVIVGLALTGLISTPPRSPPGSPGPALAFHSADALANAAAESVSGGPWTLFTFSGVDSNAQYVYPTGLVSCNGMVALPGALHYLSSDRPVIPAWQGSPSSGLVPWWLFQYENGSNAPTSDTPGAANGTVVLDVVVVNGTATALLIDSTICVQGVQPALLVGNLSDTPNVMGSAFATNASFFDSHPEINASLQLGNVQSLGLQWLVEFSTCSPFGEFTLGTASYVGWQYEVQLNATTGEVPADAPPLPPASVTCQGEA
jgi:hypothetical protein